MIFLRCISFLIGVTIAMGAPFFLLPESPTRAINFNGAVIACVAIALAASGFLMVGVAGNHFKRSLRARILAGVLLAVPMVGSIGILLQDNLPESVWALAPLFCSAAIMFMAFVFPGRRSTARRLRPRESSGVLP
jgi:hypothetical protein